VAGTFVVGSPASADEVRVDGVAVAVKQATNDRTPALAVSQVASGDVMVSQNPGELVVLPKDPDQGISLSDGKGKTIVVGLPGADKAHHAKVKNGTAVYTDAQKDVSIAAQPTAEGGARALIAIEGPDAVQ
jgi:hypothetical protein